MYDNRGKPTLCIGDLNELLYDFDISSPNVIIYGTHAFRALVKQCGFIDLGYSGLAYTWRIKDTPLNPLLSVWTIVLLM